MNVLVVMVPARAIINDVIPGSLFTVTDLLQALIPCLHLQTYHLLQSHLQSHLHGSNDTTGIAPVVYTTVLIDTSAL